MKQQRRRAARAECVIRKQARSQDLEKGGAILKE